jgi:pimeloyl-ACP methyl ester carboxylesterase
MSDMLTVALLAWCCLLAHSTTAAHMAADDDADLYLTSPQLMAKYGYPVQTHSVQTEDGYILELHRIPHGKSGPANSTRPAVLLHHALLCSSFDWVGLGPEKSLGFILADAGYDVWLANARGNTYSRKHVAIDPSEPRFWEYSWHEMGTCDVPAEIDYILNSTGHSKLYYIGHSMGTTMFFAGMSQRPEYNHKIHAMIAFAPEATFTRRKNSVIHLLEKGMERLLEGLFHFTGLHEFLPQNSVLNPISIAICRHELIISRLCVGIIFSIVGKSTQMERVRLPVLLAHTPAGASTRELTHYAQLAVSGGFGQFDFGEQTNMEKYGQATPPQYNLSLVTSPVALYYADNDKLLPVKNVMEIYRQLPNVIRKFRVPHRMFNHLDFIWGRSANYLVYRDVLAFLKKHEMDARTGH